MSLADPPRFVGDGVEAGHGPGPIQRAVDLLKLLAEAEDSVAVRDVAQALRLPPSTSHRLLRQFVTAGFVVADPATKRYRVGPALQRLAALIHSKADLAKTVQPYLEALTAEVDEASFFTTYDSSNGSVTFIAKADCPQPLSYRMHLNVPYSAYWGSSSRAIVAHLPEAEIERIIAGAGPAPVGRRDPLLERQFRRHLAQIRRRGFAVTKGHKLPGGIGTAAPVFDAVGIVGSITVTVPEIRFGPHMGPPLQRLVMRYAADLSHRLGHPSTTPPPAPPAPRSSAPQ